jgi:hypothetical protein
VQLVPSLLRGTSVVLQREITETASATCEAIEQSRALLAKLDAALAVACRGALIRNFEQLRFQSAAISDL